MADIQGQEPRNSLWRREDQLKRWAQSETNKFPAVPKDRDKAKVKFQDGCVFLAACASGDKDEVEKLLERGADINTANVDGLTALHQACIDENLEMVRFLVEKGADIDACDNEGWTALHATASCGFYDIAKYLLEQGSNVAAVNNDGELAWDISEGDELDEILIKEMEDKGIDADAARMEEEECMLKDANQWLNGTYEETPHPKTGASALHVAASKGYLKVMNILLQAGANIEATDTDGWTPLHAAAHWGQEEACKVLVENFCNMDAKNNVGQKSIDVADPDLLGFLEELKKTQATLKQDTSIAVKAGRNVPPLKRRSSVTRMSVDMRQNVMKQDVETEKTEQLKRMKHLDENEEKEKSETSTTSGDSSSDSETEKQNEINRQTTAKSKHNEDKDKTEQSEIKTNGAPTDNLVKVAQEPSSKRIEEAPEIKPSSKQATRIEDLSKSENLPKESDKEKENLHEKAQEIDKNIEINRDKDRLKERDKELNHKEQIKTPKESEKLVDKKDAISSVGDIRKTEESSEHKKDDISVSKPEELVSKSETRIDRQDSNEKELEDNQNDNRSLDSAKRNNLRRAVISLDTTNSTNSQKLTSYGRQAPNFTPKLLVKTDSTEKVDDGPSTWKGRLKKTGSASAVSDVTVSNREKEKLSRSASSPRLASDKQQEDGRDITRTRPVSLSGAGDNQESRNRFNDVFSRYKAVMSRSTSTTSPTTPTTTTSSISSSSSYLSRIKRHSDQDVTRPMSLITTPSTTQSTTTTTSSSSSSNRRSFEPPKRDEEREAERKARARKARESRRSTQGVTKEDLERAEQTLLAADKKSTVTDRDSKSDKENIPEDLTSIRRRNALDDKTEDENSRNSIRSSRDSGLLSDSSSSSYLRSLKTATTSPTTTTTTSTYTDPVSTASTRSYSRSKYLRNEEEDTSRDDSKNDEDNDSSKSSRRTKKKYRPPTGKVNLEDIQAAKQENARREEKKEEEKTSSSRYSSKYSDPSSTIHSYSSRSDRPGSYSSDRPYRPSSYSSTSTSLEKEMDYKKLYETEKLENEKLRKDMKKIETNLKDTTSELEKLKSRSETKSYGSNYEKGSDREKRALERKVSELEEEVKQMDKLKADNAKLREENRALSRVVSKLSK